MLIRIFLFALPTLVHAVDAWEQLAPPPLPQSEFSVAQVDGEI